MEDKKNARSGGIRTGANAKSDGESMHKNTDFPIEIPENADLEQPPLFQSEKLGGMPPSVFNNLPQLLREPCEKLTEQAEKDVFLVGALGVVSGLLPNYRGFYDSQYTGCNLYCYILGQYGTGKGGLKLAYQLGKAVHVQRKMLSADLQAKYRQDCLQAKESKEPEPENPGSKLLYIPANNSKSGFVELLHDNEGKGILFETEGDTLADALKTDYGGFSDVLRKAFHQEQISFYRRSGREHREIEHPLLSVVLSSTLDQYQKLIPTIQNGLFSRFLHYWLPPSPVFKDVFDRRKRGHPEYFDQLGQTFLGIYNYLQMQSAPLEFDLQDHHKGRFLEIFSQWKQELGEYVSTDLEGTVNRLGLICYRIAMLLTALRHFGENNYPTALICNDTDFENALAIVGTLKEHALAVYFDLPRPQVSQQSTELEQELIGKSQLIAECKRRHEKGESYAQIALAVLGSVSYKSKVWQWLNSKRVK